MPLATSDSQHKILQAAKALAPRLGYAAVTMVDIAQEAGVGRATLYRHYTTKEHLYTDVIRLWAEEFAEQLKRRSLRGKTVGERVSSMLRAVIKEGADNLELLTAQIACSIADAPDLRANYIKVEESIGALLAIALGTAVSQRQALAASVLSHVLMSSNIILVAGHTTPKAIAEEMIAAAALLLADVWELPVGK